VVGLAQIIVCAHHLPSQEKHRNSNTRCLYYETQSTHKEMNNMHFTHNWGFLLLAIWLILYGLIALLGLSFSGLGVIMAILALAAGILILLER
jgi:hypothetical protein